MATQVLIAHTGQRLEVDTSQFSNLDDLKVWVARNSEVPLQHMVALTPQGRSVKYASLHAEKELYIYDIRVTQASSSSSSSLVSNLPSPKAYSVANAPNSIQDVKVISAWQNLYKDRRTWALNLADDCAGMNTETRARYDEIDVMIKCLDAAVANLEISVKQIEPKYAELKKWVEPALREHEQLAVSWEQYLHLARNTPISATMMRFMTRRENGRSSPTLEDLIELDTARKAGKLAPTAKRRFADKAAELDKANSNMHQGLASLIASFEDVMGRSVLAHHEDSTQLLQDIEVVVKQMDSDYRTALAYAGSQKDLAQASKTASNHTERLIPNLKKRAKEMEEMLQYATENRNAIASESVLLMRTITDITSLHSNVRSQINVLNQSEDDMTTFDYLRLVHQLPYMYASFAVESIRRREWTDKVKLDSSTLANEMALFQDEESKRRRRWQKMVGSMYGPELDTNVMGLEVNLHGNDEAWPVLAKEELEDYLQRLQEQNTDPAILEDISKLVQELHSPTKQQSKRLKAFKNGSVHEAVLGRSGLMIRGDDDLLRTLQDDKSKLETKLKTSESRVRRLEDLLHRQSQASRQGSLFQPPPARSQERPGSSASIRSNRLEDRRRSSDGADPLLRRIAQLENEIREERLKSTKLQKDMGAQATERDEMKGQLDEVNSIKKDLLENMEALKNEFMGERKSYEDEIKALKARIEDNEDEMDHFGESRENEKASYDDKLRTLEAEMERLVKEGNDEMLKVQGQVEFLRKEAQTQRDKLDISNRDAQAARDDHRSTAKQLEDAQDMAERQAQVYQRLHADLLPDAAVPDDALDLAEALASYTADLDSKLQEARNEHIIAKTDLENASYTTKELRTEIAQASAKLAQHETAVKEITEALSESKAKATALDSELTDAREEIRKLRVQLSDGETGSETLQKKLESEEKRVSQLTEELATRQSRVGSLEEEVFLLNTKATSMQEKISSMTDHYTSRSEKTKDLTQRVFSQNDRLIRLLERIGYSVTRNEAEMIVTKIPRSERQTQNPNDSSDPGSSIKRSLNLSSRNLSSRNLSDSADLELLYWMNETDTSAETEKYQNFLNKLGTFDMDVFADTIYHRIKEAEHKARKWQREARAYRERAHQFHKDAHDKIAFRNFKEGDLALFLPTRNQQAGAWAAFNVGFPHFFLREQDNHRLRHREWLVARISKVQERVVDLSKSVQQPSTKNDKDSLDEGGNDNPFQLSDGLRWYLIDAHEDKPGAPTTPGMGKSTVAANTVAATANIQTQPIRTKGKNRDSITSIEGINKTLSKSLESRRSSSGSKALPFSISGGFLKSSALASETDSLRAVAPETPLGTSPLHNPSMLANAIAGRIGERENNQTPEASSCNGQALPADQASTETPEVRDVDALNGP
ncbi:hypothetical protein VHEMI02689 [[Torrubiella] hemipterigena]|uniref:Autophagy-related protein 11 n=1 Tax=[Torrubiella] hemipterigena TaxID=1531966 RepID=A0A0A1TBD3_9HYPO|nr:hypothetical protein VHEMI02689 [[Torrubiella] hemipterigena]